MRACVCAIACCGTVICVCAMCHTSKYIERKVVIQFRVLPVEIIRKKRSLRLVWRYTWCFLLQKAAVARKWTNSKFLITNKPTQGEHKSTDNQCKYYHELNDMLKARTDKEGLYNARAVQLAIRADRLRICFLVSYIFYNHELFVPNFYKTSTCKM